MVYDHGQSIMLTGHGQIERYYTGNGPNPEQLFCDLWNCEYNLEGKAEALHNNIINGTAVVHFNGGMVMLHGL